VFELASSDAVTASLSPCLRFLPRLLAAAVELATTSVERCRLTDTTNGAAGHGKPKSGAEISSSLTSACETACPIGHTFTRRSWAALESSKAGFAPKSAGSGAESASDAVALACDGNLHTVRPLASSHTLMCARPAPIRSESSFESASL